MELKDIITQAVAESITVNGFDRKSFHKVVKDSVGDFINENSEQFQGLLIEEAVKYLKIPHKIKVETVDKKDLEFVPHYQFQSLVNCINTGIPVMMVGLPGTGKTTSAEQAALALGLKFHAISVGVQTTKSDILGFIDANGEYRATAFRKAFENGGVFLMDEVDAGNPNVLIVVNSALSNGFCEFPDKMVRAHKDFRFVATANTYGTGSDVKFIGRNQLDSATIDRFITIDWNIDENIEKIITNNNQWFNRVLSLRKAAETKKIDIMVTPRVSIYGARLIEVGFTELEAANMTILRGKDKDTAHFIRQHMDLL